MQTLNPCDLVQLTLSATGTELLEDGEGGYYIDYFLRNDVDFNLSAFHNFIITPSIPELSLSLCGNVVYIWEVADNPDISGRKDVLWIKPDYFEQPG